MINSSSWIRSLALAILLAGCSPAADTTPSGSGGATGGAGVPQGTGGNTTSGTGGATTEGTGGAAPSSTGGATTPAGTGGQAGPGTGGTIGTGGSQATGGGGATGAAGARGTGGAAGQPATTGGGGVSAQGNCPAGALLCEDFESFPTMATPINSNNWKSRVNGTATVMVDTTHARSGTKAVHFHATTVSNSQRAYLLNQAAPVFPVTGNKLYVRFMMYIGRYMSVTGTSIHNRIAWVGSAATLSSGGNGPGYSFATYNGLTIERLTNPSQGFQRDTGQKLDDVARQNKWQCFEFEIDNMGGVPAGELAGSTVMPHIWQEGTELKLSAAGTAEQWLPAPFEALQFSLWCPQTDPMPTDYWIDDIVMSGQRINCP